MLSRLRQLASRQLSHPAGRGGRVVAALMNRGNRKMNTHAVELLEVEDGTRVLDLGFGGGLALELLLPRGAHVIGVDRAADMVAAARARYRDAIADGRLVVLEGEVAALPLSEAAVDRVLTINTIYFWQDFPSALREIHRVLAPGGRLLIGIRDGSVMNNVSREVFTIRTPDDVRAALAEAAFTDLRIESPTDQEVHYLIASKPSAP